MRRWWGTLTDDERLHLVEHRSGPIGNLEGIPLRYRDAANRRTLHRYLDRAPLTSDAERETFAQLEMTSVPTQIGDQTVQVNQLLHTFDPTRRRIAVAYAPYHHNFKPSDADAVAIYIPGTGVEFRQFNSQMVRTQRLDTELRNADGDFAQRGVTVAWLGYRNPPHLLAALSPHYAWAGANRLASTVAGFHATMDDPHVGLIGHSYGARVALRAASHTDATIDTVTLVAPPGGGLNRSFDAASQRLGRDVKVLVYDSDFLSRHEGSWRRLLRGPLTFSHGIDLGQPRPGVRVWRPASPPDEIVDISGGSHSAYFDDREALQRIVTGVLGAEPDRALHPAEQRKDGHVTL